MDATSPRAAEYQQHLFDTLQATVRGIRNYGGDLAGLSLLAIGFIGMLALLGFSQGTWTSAVSSLLLVWLGWGAALAPLSLLVVGAVLVARGMGWRSRISWVRVFSAELAAFCFLGGAHLRLAAHVAHDRNMEVDAVLQSGGMLVQALEGKGGGKIGWAVAVFFGELVTDSTGWLLVVIGVAAFSVALGLRWQHFLLGLISLQRRLAHSQGNNSPRPVRGIILSAPRGTSASS